MTTADAIYSEFKEKYNANSTRSENTLIKGKELRTRYNANRMEVVHFKHI